MSLGSPRRTHNAIGNESEDFVQASQDQDPSRTSWFLLYFQFNSAVTGPGRHAQFGLRRMVGEARVPAENMEVGLWVDQMSAGTKYRPRTRTTRGQEMDCGRRTSDEINDIAAKLGGCVFIDHHRDSNRFSSRRTFGF